MNLVTICKQRLLTFAIALSAIALLNVTAFAATTFHIEPSSDQLMFNTHAGSTVTKTLHIQNTSQTPLSLGMLLSGSPQFALAGGVPTVTVPVGSTQDVSLTYSPLVAGSATGSLKIVSLTGDSETVQLNGQAIQSGLDRVISPNDVSYNATVGQSQCLPVNINNQSLGIVSISNIQVTGDTSEFHASYGGSNQISSGNSGSLNVCFTPVTANGSVRALLTYTYTSLLDSAFHGTQTVLLEGLARSAGNTADSMFFQLTNQLNFVNVGVGQQSCQSIRISNPTSQAITIDSATVSGAGAAAYNVTGANNLNVTSGMTQYVNVCFTPTQAGFQNGVIGFNYTTTSNGTPVHGTLYTNVYGNAVTLDSNGIGGESNNCIAVRRAGGVLGPILQGGTTQDAIYLTNRTAGPVTISGASVTTGDSSAFSVNGGQFPLTLQSGQEGQLMVNFNPAVNNALDQVRYTSQIVLTTVGSNVCGPITLHVGGVAVPAHDTTRFTLGGNGNGGINDTTGFGGVGRVIGIVNNGSTACSIDTVTFYNTTANSVNVNNVYLPASANFTLLGTSMGTQYPISVPAGGSLSTYIQFCANGKVNTLLQDQLFISTDQSIQPQSYIVQGIQSAPSSVRISQGATSVNFSISPNPTAGQVSITVENARSTNVEVYDIVGNLVASVAGTSSLKWDGRNQMGSQLANGTYIVRVSGTTDQGTPFVASKHIVIEH